MIKYINFSIFHSAHGRPARPLCFMFLSLISEVSTSGRPDEKSHFPPVKIVSKQNTMAHDGN
jgi:hypothetical protein